MSNRDLCNHHGRQRDTYSTYSRLAFLRSMIVMYKGADTRLSRFNLKRYTNEYTALKGKMFGINRDSLSECEIEADIDLDRHRERAFYGMAW